MNAESIQSGWQLFIKSCDPRGQFSAVQRREMRRAFYSGVLQSTVVIGTCIQDGMPAVEALIKTGDDAMEEVKGMIREDSQRN